MPPELTGISATSTSNAITLGQKEQILRRIRLRCTRSGRWHSVFGSLCGSDLGGEFPMKSAIAAHLPDEHFVIRVDGRENRAIDVSWTLLEKACSFGISFRSTT